MADEQPIRATSSTVACDGGGGPLGHPAVYLKFGREREIVCPYCSRRFVLEADPEKVSH